MRLEAPVPIVDAFSAIVAPERSPSASGFSVRVESLDSAPDALHWRFVLPDSSAEFGPMPPARVAQSLLTQFTRLTVLTHPTAWFLHAGVVGTDDGAVVAMAPSGTGKSTFVAKLVASGHRYLSDEMAWIDPQAWEVIEYPKPIGLDARSLSLVGIPQPRSAPTSDPRGQLEWLVDPADLRPEPVGVPTGRERLAAAVSLVRGREVGSDPIRPMSGAREAAAILANQLNLMAHPDPLRSACELRAAVPIVEVAVDDLDAAVRELPRAGHVAGRTALRWYATVPSAAEPAEAGPAADCGHRRFDAFASPETNEQLSVASFADGSAIVMGCRSGHYALTSTGGARLAAACGRGRPIIDLAAECDVPVVYAERYFDQLEAAGLVGLGGTR